MNFKTWLESDLKITDTYPVNKSMYDMNDPEDRRRYEDDLRDSIAFRKRKREIVSEKLIREPYVITCWRGFDLRSFSRDVVESGGGMTINGDKAMEGMLWFTHSLQPSGAIDYAMSRARGDGYLLTYPLKCTRSYVVSTYDDGGKLERLPDDVNDVQTELRGSAVVEGRFYELPEGWYFTWQIQKHIGFKGSLEIDKSMLRRIR